MCVVTALAVAGTAMSAVSAITQGQSEASADKYNASIASQNAISVQQQAEGAAQIQQEQAKRTLGAATAAYGASGIVSGTGTPLDVLANSAGAAERDRQNIIYKGQLQAAGYEDQSSLDRSAATNALDSGYMKATGVLLSGGSKAYGMIGKGPGSSISMDSGSSEGGY